MGVNRCSTYYLKAMEAMAKFLPKMKRRPLKECYPDAPPNKEQKKFKTRIEYTLPDDD